MTAGFSSLSLMALLLLGTPLNLPLSVPPLAEDPALSQMAPEQCLWYMSLAGVDKANPASKNKAEQLLAEDDVQRFLHDLSARLKNSFIKATKNEARAKVVGEEGPKLVETLLRRPMCAYLMGAGPAPNGVAVRAGIVVNLGDDSAATKASLEKIELSLLGAATPSSATANWRTLPTPPGAPQVQWGIKQEYLVVGIGVGEADSLWNRKGKPAPDWLTNLRGQLKVERPAMVQFINLQSLVGMSQVAMNFTPGLPRSQDLIDALGVRNLKYYASVSGLDKESYCSRALVATDGQPTGLLSHLGGQPLNAESLAPIPADASFAVAARIDAKKLTDGLIGILALIDPRPAAEIQRDLEEQAKLTGVSVQNDVLAALGDTWCIYNSPGDGGLVFTGLTVTATLRDRQKLIAANEKLIAFSKSQEVHSKAQEAEGVPFGPIHGPIVAEMEYRGQKIHFVNFVGEPFPFAPAWCITDKHFVFALFPQMIKAYLERQATGKSLASVPEVANGLSGSPGVITFQDTPAMFKLVYPLAQFLVQLGCAELQRQGVDLDIGMLPSARAISPHLIPSVSTLQQTKEGIRLESRGTLPTGIGALPLMAAGFALPATVGARESAQRAQSSNNLKQIALAMHNFLSVHKTFPPAVHADKDGKPLLSWRVMILPFIEEQPLFQQFKLDEPWDSENNKKLIDKMPAVYAAPGSKVAGDFKTVYLTMRGANTAFPGAKGTHIKDILDGTSNTIMVVEASDEKAVIWTKPDDFEPDDMNPIAGLVGLREGVFQAAMCDGSVRTLSQGLPPDVLKALFSRAGGETIQLP